jgi:hypothetical protein
MSRITPESHREIAFRVCDGIEVALLWAPADDRVVVAVVDTKANDAFGLPVEKHRAFDAFMHPFAYAAATCRPLAATG